jgi:hypothetical protein
MSPILRGLAERAPAADEEREAAFAQAAQPAQQGVVGAGVHVELSACGCPKSGSGSLTCRFILDVSPA